MNSNQLFESPDQYLFAFEENAALFMDMDRAAYHRSVFLDGRISPRSQTVRRIPLDQLYATSARRPASEVGYIFHVAHCGSTLLARALDAPDKNLVLREPVALRRLGVEAGGERFGRAHGQDWERRTRLAHQMFARRYAPGAVTIVKANVPVNFMIPDLTELVPDQSAIAIYFPLEEYLVAILRSPNHRRWVDIVSGEVRGAITALTGVAAPQSNGEAAALLWLAQMRIYHELIARNPRAASLNAEDLFNRPKDTILAASAHFGQPQSDQAAQRTVESELFAHYSKNPKVAFTNQSRLERQRAMREEIANELAQARTFIQRLPATAALPQRLGRNLLGGEGARLLEVNP